ncbi:hypothetical protein D3C74_336120 [compost metagenome]
MVQHIVSAICRVIPGILQRAANPASDGLVVQIAAGDDRTERDGQPGVALPPAAEISQEIKAIGRIGESGFMDDEPCIDLPVTHRRHNLIEGQDNDLGRAARHLLCRP